TVVRKLLDDALLGRDLQRRRSTVLRRCGVDARGHRRSGVFQRQVEHERTALAGGAAQVDFTAEQACKFAADGETEAGAAVFPAGAGIRLLERLEDQLLLLQRNADAS